MKLKCKGGVLEALNGSLQFGEISVTLLEVIVGEAPVVWSEVEVVRVIVDHGEIFYNLGPVRSE
jgi:hypothetical protein